MLRRILPLLSVAVVFTAAAAASSMAQDEPLEPPIVDGVALDMATLPRVMIDGVVTDGPQRLTLTGELVLDADDPADLCEEASAISLTPSRPSDGISFDVRDFTASPTDPLLACSWGNPGRRQGYRTLWYQLIAPVSGRITLDTFGSSYDTVLGVFRSTEVEIADACVNLTRVACNDDANGFSSQLTLTVSAGEVFYIVVADWQAGVPGPVQVNFSALLQPVTPLWDTLTTSPLTPALSRHAAVSYQDKVYVIGGQTGGAGLPFVSSQLWRLDTFNEIWEAMAPIPGAGYSNTTAARVGTRIYLPSGYNGNNLSFDGLHWLYDINVDAWSLAAGIDSADLPSTGHFGWSASAVPPSDDRYFLLGGTSTPELFSSTAQALRASYVFLANENTWLPIDPMPTGRYAHTAAWISTNNLGACVAGGLGHQPGAEEFVFHTVTECYNPALGWRSFANINIPRIGAGSVVGPDGKWYVYGGLRPLGALLVPVLQTEVFDPRRNTWSILPPQYNLGGQQAGAGRAFASGGLIGNKLYVVGGSIFINGEHALPLTEQITLPTATVYLPSQLYYGQDFLAPDDTFLTANFLPFGLDYVSNFSNQRDFFDFLTFSLPVPMDIRLKLQVPDDNDFDLYLYDDNKREWASSIQPFNGEDETIEILLPAGRFFILVERAFPTAQPNQGAFYHLMMLN